ncbi:putative sec1 family superfamily [Phaeomoniella chlamydospora]|uniref:Putative sec1 family superfamily n=1 Tax=Phaeomoniella chlamydospora TaxID=158046 RepID=A0A0G2DU26_PHACM|nr:putative sec1 family superfamily [Phaeomoniella chlamydospora]
MMFSIKILRIVSICVSLGEHPIVRYYRPRNPTHEAGVLCSHLARFVQEELDLFARYHPEFPPQSPRPRGVLLITDRSLDLFSPLVHEFTYQALALDVLPISDGDKVTYKYISNQGRPNEEEKHVDIGEKDKIWVANRHMHMKDLLEKLVADFNKFRAENPQFADNDDEAATNVNTIKDMLVGLSGFQEGKEGFALHLEMAEKCVKIFQDRKLLDVGSVEQSLSTGLDEDYRKPRNMAEQVVRLLDDDSVTRDDRLRLLLLYLMYRNGLLPGDIQKLLAHAQLPPQNGEVIQNLDLLGVRVNKPLKDAAPPPQPVIAVKAPTMPLEDENTLSRFEPTLKSILQEQIKGTLDQSIFPFTKVDPNDTMMGPQGDSQASLRSAKPTWARSRPSANEPRQRVLVFMAGGATYAESRACYEVSQSMSRDVILTTSHMLTPKLFMRQLGDLSIDRRRLDLPADRLPQKAPAHLFEREAPPKPPPQPSQPKPTALPSKPKLASPPTAAIANMNLGQRTDDWPRPGTNGSFVTPTQISSPDTGSKGKLSKKDKDKDKEKKKHRFF